MKYWKVDRYRWQEQNPYLGPYKTLEEAESYCEKIRKAHKDFFSVIKTIEGFGVEQDAHG